MHYKRIGLGILLICALTLLLTACGSSAGASSQQVQVTETDFHIASNVTSFTPGVHYQFMITNKGKVAHEFMVMPKPEGDMSMMSMNDMDKLALAKMESIAPGASVTLNYTFPSSTSGSHPEFACYYPGHYMAGMKLDVSVGS
jgi:uncharacterized cupredoxin-like copper-binding protein